MLHPEIRAQTLLGHYQRLAGILAVFQYSGDNVQPELLELYRARSTSDLRVEIDDSVDDSRCLRNG
jgi:hypothetical protein